MEYIVNLYEDGRGFKIVPDNGNRLLTTAQAAKYLNIAEISLRKMRLVNRGPKYTKLESSVRYRIEDLETYIKQGLV